MTAKKSPYLSPHGEVVTPNPMAAANVQRGIPADCIRQPDLLALRGVSAETIRRYFRDGKLIDHEPNPRGGSFALISVAEFDRVRTDPKFQGKGRKLLVGR